MSYTLALNSTNVTGPNNSTFQYTFASGSFVAKDAEIALSSASIPYSWYNVSTYYNNQNFSLVFPLAASTTTLNITLPAGYYDVRRACVGCVDGGGTSLGSNGVVVRRACCV